MRSTLILCLFTAAALSAQVRFNSDQVAVDIDGKPFTTFHYGEEANKPFLAPLRSASGKIVTRRFPQLYLPDESHDHLHHRGLWFSYDDVNGVKFWENDPSYTKPNIGKIVVRKATWKDGGRAGTLNALLDWQAPDGQVLLHEDRDMTFYSDPKLRIIDFKIVLTAAQDVTFGDTKEGAFAIRLADAFTEKKGGKSVNADGARMMANIWGKRSKWVDYTAAVDGEQLGVAIFDNPQNPNFPNYWHARDYGLFSMNPFGQKSFDEDKEERKTKLPKGQSLTYRWRVVIHPGDADSGHVADLYSDYTTKH